MQNNRVNREIHEAILKSGVKKWQVAEMLGIADTTFSKRLRKELAETEKQRILSIISELDLREEA